MTVLLLFLMNLMAAPETRQEQIVKCDISIVSATQNNVDQLTEKDVIDFLSTFGDACKNNAEFGEYSNEVLFLILDKQTDLTIKTMTTEEQKLEIDVILDDISSPINDIINVKAILEKVERVKVNGSIKKKVIERLKTAIANN
jgi:hypothetical protein